LTAWIKIFSVWPTVQIELVGCEKVLTKLY
jgi:hypothetical protein